MKSYLIDYPIYVQKCEELKMLRDEAKEKSQCYISCGLSDGMPKGNKITDPTFEKANAHILNQKHYRLYSELLKSEQKIVDRMNKFIEGLDRVDKQIIKDVYCKQRGRLKVCEELNISMRGLERKLNRIFKEER